jgi:hypothetical protein
MSAGRERLLALWRAELTRRALRETTDLVEAQAAVELALRDQPEPPAELLYDLPGGACLRVLDRALAKMRSAEEAALSLVERRRDAEQR